MTLLPLSKEPLAVPKDRDMLPSERREFVNTHRTCIFGYARLNDGPAMSVVYYVPDDSGALYVSTMSDRAKAKAVARDGKVSLCVLDETWPFSYLQVYCDAAIETDPDLVCDVMMAVGWRMSGEKVGEEARPLVDKMRIDEKRIVMKCTPYASFATPPRHLHNSDQDEKLTHWLSGSVAWDALDPE